MIIKKIMNEPVSSLRYLERYVNDGSPSGFTEINRTKGFTDPFSLKKYFSLYILEAPSEKFLTYGIIPDDLFPIDESKNSTNWIFIHPDMLENDCLVRYRQNINIFSEFDVVPTSSARTVQVTNSDNLFYIKLHYDDIIGRFYRRLPYHKAIAGPEMSKDIIGAINNDLLPECFSVLPELGARVLLLDSDLEKSWGMVIRNSSPIGKKIDRTRSLIPFFSLFSMDRLAKDDNPLLIEIIRSLGIAPSDYALQKILLPIQEIYFELIIKLGYQIELNAQNILIAIDNQLNCCSIVFRDLMGIKKDIDIREINNLSTNFDSAPYRCISSNNPESYYGITHSLGYDFKVGEYVFEPIIKLISSYFKISRYEMQNKIKESAKKYINRLPNNYFPDEVHWYVKKGIMFAKSDAFEKRKNPKYR